MTALVFSEPHGVRHEDRRTVPFGKRVPLPDPVGIEPETEAPQNRVR